MTITTSSSSSSSSTAGPCSGWEPETPVGDTLLRRFVLGHAEKIELLAAAAAGGRVERRADALLTSSPSPWPFDNAVVLLRPPVSESALAEIRCRARAFFPAGRPWILWTAWPTPDLSRSGLRLVGHPPLMVRPPAPVLPPSPGLEVIEVVDRVGLDDFEATLAAGFPFPAREGAAGSLVAENLLGAAVRLFVGYRDGRPIGVAGAVPAQGLLHIDWVATLPGERGRGVGTALTTAAVASSARLPAGLLASDAGRPVYRRLGFFDLLRTTIWEAS